MELVADILYANRYRLLKELGCGSFGEVWLALDEQLDNMQVAIKVYIALDDRGIEEFKKEYKTAYDLNHPNLLHANHFDICDRRPFLVMPYCPDSALSLVGNCDRDTLWQFIKDVSAGLAYLHSKDIVHHDIKPDNILRTEDGRFVITDFGISTKMRSTLRRNSTRAMSENSSGGSLPYMGPEMFSAKPESVKATDIWAFGVTLYEMITGNLPFFGQGGVMQLNGAAIPELEYEDPEIVRLVQACMFKDTWDRPTAEMIAIWDVGQNIRTKNSAHEYPSPKSSFEATIPTRDTISFPKRTHNKKTRSRALLVALLIIIITTGLFIIKRSLNRNDYFEKIYWSAFGEQNAKKYLGNKTISLSTSPSGLRYCILSAGNTERAKDKDKVQVTYRMSFRDGRVVDEMTEPVYFFPEYLIVGVREAFKYIGKGGEIILSIPPDLGYGERGGGSIPGNATLIMYLKIHDIIPESQLDLI